MILDDALRFASIPVWLGCMAVLAPAAGRIMRRRGRYLDPLLVVIFLLALNRLSFAVHVSAEMSHASSVVLGGIMAWFAFWYQRHDHA